VADGATGFFARTDDEWRDRLLALATSPDLRAGVAARARRRVETEYSLRVWGPRFADALTAASQGRVPHFDAHDLSTGHG
jgi:hypothetical protein